MSKNSVCTVKANVSKIELGINMQSVTQVRNSGRAKSITEDNYNLDIRG